MTDKSIELYNLMVRRGYPEAFSELIARELSTEFTAGRMMGYILRGEHTLEDVADEMLAIISERDSWVGKLVSEQANAKITEFYNRPRDPEDDDRR